MQVENTIRWRSTVSEDGEELRESNAKIVKWSDGTSVHLFYSKKNVHQSHLKQIIVKYFFTLLKFVFLTLLHTAHIRKLRDRSDIEYFFISFISNK